MTLSRILALLVLSFSLPAHSLTNECGDFTSIDGTGYLVAPSGKDDTANIECAFESAKAQGLSSITLTEGDFKVSSLEVVGYEGSFQGSNQKRSRILIANNSVECGDEYDDAEGIITFFGGNVSVRKMTLDVDRPCARGSSYIALRFTQQSCGARTHFGNVDRITLIGSGPDTDDKSVGVTMAGQDRCVADQKGSLGTFKLNRSTLMGFVIGADVSLLGGGQVDINFNEFSDVSEAVTMENANQNATVTGNTFDYYYDGVIVYTSKDYAPGSSRLVVHSNKFNQASGGGTYAFGVRVFTAEKRTAISTVISNNTFNLIDRQLDDESQFGIGLFDVDNAVIVSNTFEGSATVGIYIDAFEFSKAAEGNTIVGNSFKQDNSFEKIDVFLGENADKTVIGKQNAFVRDYGTNNIAL